MAIFAAGQREEYAETLENSTVVMIPGEVMKNLMEKKGVASIEDLRELAIEADVRMIACQMTMDLFEYSLDDMIEGPELGGAATYIECATQADINLFI